MSAIRFLGCSVVRFSSNVGWGESPSTVNLLLVEDTKNNDRFILGTNPDNGVGSPFTFVFGGYTFRGILQSWRQLNGQNGNPTFEVSLADPREVLIGTTIVTGSYYATTSQTPNILNAFGYYENQAFGSSYANEGGMPWRTLYPMVNAMANDTIEFKTFGSKLRYKTDTYKLDISELESAPFFYRIRGVPSVSLMDMINQRCTDAGLDYVISLQEDNTIKVKTISRRRQIASNNGPNSGSINRYLESKTQIVNKSRGWELRNDGPTSKMIVGANISELYQTLGTDVRPYWGLDPNGNLLLSNDLEDTTTVTLNSLCCVDFIGPLYQASVAEIRLAMMGQQAWINYIALKRRDIADRLGLESNYDAPLLELITRGQPSPFDTPALPLQAFTPEYARFLASAKQADKAYNNAARLHRLLANAGQQHYGKTFAVFLPMILQKVDPETQTITNSHDIDQEGGYTEGLTPPLGLSELNQLGFEKSMNRLQPFAFFEGSRIDPLTSSSSSSVLQTNGAYVKAQVDSYIYFVPIPCVIMSLSQPIMKKSDYYPHYIDDYISNVLPVNPATGKTDPALSLYLSSNMVPTAGQSIVPKHLMPTAVAIPIRNNIFTYGPWWLNGAVAHSEFEKDDSLAPWNYGGIASMNQAAYNKLFSSATNLITAETGEFEEAGVPQFSLGDLLLAEGSNITGIDVNVGQGGAVTSYRLRTFDFRFLQSFSKKQEERLARIGRGINTLRTRVREGYQKFYDNVVVVHQAYLEGCHPALNPKTPHTILYGCEYNFDNKTAYTETGVMTPADAMVLCDSRQKGNDKFKRTAIMSTNGLIRPFSTLYQDDLLPCFVKPKSGLGASVANFTPTSHSLNPFRYKNDILVYSRGTNFSQDLKSVDYNFNTKKLDYTRQSDLATDVRAMAMRGPIIIAGYGFNTYCKSAVDTFRRNGDWEAARDSMEEADRADVQGWRAGPVDLLWDESRGVWTAHTLTLGKLQATIPSKGTGKVDIYGIDDAVVDTVNVYNPWASSVEKDSLIAFGYVAHKNKMCIISANC